MKKKVICAMSGGVDSSVAAALLKKGGPAPEQVRYGVNFEVMGVFMKFWSESKEKGNRCCGEDSERRARQVAKILKIPFYVFNFGKEFKKRVVDYFLGESKAGLTPNPCVVCNKEIKFGLLLEKALALGADYVATGHYALKREIKNKKGPYGESLKATAKIKNYELLKSKDKKKDQSYFLWRLSQDQLKHILFPIGDYNKTQVRNLAKKFKLPVTDFKESQEICFIKTNIQDFLKRRLKSMKGPVIEQTNKGVEKIISRHDGLWFYTIGQRKGLGLAGGPYYVLDKDIKKNALMITKNGKDLFKKELKVKNVNWISGNTHRLPFKIRIKTRSQQALSGAVIAKKLPRGRYKIVFSKGERAVAPGQSAVFYSGRKLVGGGVIC